MSHVVECSLPRPHAISKCRILCETWEVSGAILVDHDYC